MSNVRKYESYKILITYNNGDTEEIKYDGINTSNYTEMIKLYKSVKDQYSEESVTIEFIGTNSDGTMKIFWTKKIENKTEDEVTDDTIPTNVLLERLSEVILALEGRRDRVSKKQSLLNKEQDVNLHKIETISYSNIKSEEELNLEKLRIFNELEKIRVERREVKTEFVLVKNFFEKFEHKVLLEKINKNLQKYNEINSKEKEYFSEEKLEELNIMKKIPYRTEKERISLIKQLSPKYDKVYYESGEVICYSYGYHHNKDKIAR